MLGKVLATLLVVSWVVLSAVDMPEDFNLAESHKIQACESVGFAGFGRAGKVVNNVVENGSRRIAVAEAGLFGSPSGQNARFQTSEQLTKSPRKGRKIYQLHSAFLI